MRQYLSLAAASLLVGCATAPTASTPAAPTGVRLAYAAAAPATVTYQFSDSSGFNIQGGAIGEIRVTAQANGTADATFAPLPVYLSAAVIYFVICFSISQLSQKLERRLRVAR